MRFAYPMQKVQDWLTQQWVIFRGRKINPGDYSWLIGPFGNLDAINRDFIDQFAEREKLVIVRDAKPGGLIPSMTGLNLKEDAYASLSKQVIHFYESTASYDLYFSVKWNPFFRVFGILINKLFSNRLNQLHIPTKDSKDAEAIDSELITMIDPEQDHLKYTFWLRTIRSSGQTVYSGVYGTTVLPCGTTCIKAVFPLPNGNATVIMVPAVGENGELILESSGKKFGDAGFYFLLKDSKGSYWSQYIRSFRDRLVIKSEGEGLSAEQVLTLWKQEVLRFHYQIEKK